MSAEENKVIIRRYLEQAWGKGDWQAVEEAVAEDVILHDQVRDGDLPPGREGLRVAMERFRTGMPDLTFRVEELVAEGDLVAIRWSSTGTHAGEFNGFPATGRVGTAEGIAIVRMQDGRIVEGWQETDRLGMAQQLGMVPKGPMPRPLARAMAFGIRLKDRLSSRRRH